LNENSILPLYYQFKNLIKQKIKSGEWKVNERIPSEAELIAEYGVTHHTVIKALNDLTREGLIYAKKGKGRFVSPDKITEKLQILSSYTESLKERGIIPDIRVINKELISPEMFVARSLMLNENDKVIKIERVSYINGSPEVYLLSCIPQKIAPQLLEIDILNKSIYRLLKDLYSIIPVKAQNYIEASYAEDYIANILKIREGSLILINEGISFTNDNIPVEYTKIIYKGDRYRFYIESHKK
jgi:GntR family transcriptional regulator